MDWMSFLLMGFGAPGFALGALITRDIWMGLPPAMLLIFASMGFLVGSIIGQNRQRTWEGATTGLLLGPVGWLITSVRPQRASE